jgi:hypothetical protein
MSKFPGSFVIEQGDVVTILGFGDYTACSVYVPPMLGGPSAGTLWGLVSKSGGYYTTVAVVRGYEGVSLETIVGKGSVRDVTDIVRGGVPMQVLSNPNRPLRELKRIVYQRTRSFQKLELLVGPSPCGGLVAVTRSTLMPAARLFEAGSTYGDLLTRLGLRSEMVLETEWNN